MSNSIKIDSGVRLLVNDDESRVITFNPKDVLFAERFYRLVGDFQVKTNELEQRAKELDANSSLDENDIPVNMQARLDFLKDTCTYMRGEIDKVFGEGTSQTVFGDALNLDAFHQFFAGVTPYMQTARSEKISKYTPKVQKPKRLRRK